MISRTLFIPVCIVLHLTRHASVMHTTANLLNVWRVWRKESSCRNKLRPYKRACDLNACRCLMYCYHQLSVWRSLCNKPATFSYCSLLWFAVSSKCQQATVIIPSTNHYPRDYYWIGTREELFCNSSRYIRTKAEACLDPAQLALGNSHEKHLWISLRWNSKARQLTLTDWWWWL